MGDVIKFLALGGLDGGGTNLYCIEINDDIFVFSAGCGFPDRFTPGVDYVISDFSYLIKKKDHIAGYFIPSAANEEFGALPYVYRECPAPIYCSSFTSMFITVMSAQRNLDIKYDIKEINLPSTLEIAGRNVTFFRTCSNEPDSFGMAINTTQGNVVFSGSFIIEYSINPKFAIDFNTLSKLSEQKNALLLISSKNAQRKGYTSPNHRIYDKVVKEITESKNKTYIAIYSSNVYNFLEVLFAALNKNKFVCLYDKETEMLFQGLVFGGLAEIPFKNIIKASNLHKYKSSDVVIIIAGEGSDLYTKIGSICEPDETVPAMLIKPEDSFVLACPPSPNFEVLSISVLDEIYKTDCKVVPISRREFVYMHPSEDDIKIVSAMLNPKFSIPIKGAYKDLTACKDILSDMHAGSNRDTLYVLNNGDIFTLADGKASVSHVEDVSIGTLLVDGSGVGDVAKDIIKERNDLAADGVVAMSCLIDKEQKQIVGGLDIQMRGFLFVKESENIINGLEKLFISIVKEHLQDENFDREECINHAKEECLKFTRKTTMRTPVFDINVLSIDDFK